MDEIKITYEDIVAEFGPDFLKFDDEISHNNEGNGLDSSGVGVSLRCQRSRVRASSGLDFFPLQFLYEISNK